MSDDEMLRVLAERDKLIQKLVERMDVFQTFVDAQMPATLAQIERANDHAAAIVRLIEGNQTAAADIATIKNDISETKAAIALILVTLEKGPRH